MPALEVERLTVRYGAVEALRDVSLVAPSGEVTAVLGANGAGKTTLLRAVTGLVHPSAGSVRYDGEELTGLAVEDVVRRGVAHVPEGRGVIEELSVGENLALGGLWRPRAQRSSALDSVLASFPVLAEKRHMPAATLSGGERQALAIGRSLVAGPGLLLLDEPSLGLAPTVIAVLMERLVALARDFGTTVLLVEQNVRTALSVAARAVVINLGSVVLSDTADALRADPDLRRRFLGF